MHLELLREGLVRYEPTAVPSYSSGPVGRRDGCVWGIGATRHAGAVRTETLRAFKEDEYRKVIAALP